MKENKKVNILNEFQSNLKEIETEINSLEKIYHTLSHLKVKEYNILGGKRIQLLECIETIKNH